MAGLLDMLNTPEGIFALGLLDASAPRPVRTSLGGGLLQAMQGAQSWQQGQEDRAQRAALQALQMDHLRAQIGDTQAQQAQRAAQADQLRRRATMVDAWLSQAQGDVPAANADTMRATGSLAPTVANAQVQGAALQQRQQQNPLFGIPQQAIQADLAFNDGKGLADMIFKRGAPNIDFINGLAVDKNRTAHGFSVPTVSQDGKASQVIPDPSAPGGFRIVAPAGAVETFSGYRNADEAAKASFDLVKVFNPGTGREEYVSRSQALGRAGQEGQPGTPPSALRTGGGMPPLWREQVLADLADPRTQFSSPGVRATVMRAAGAAAGNSTPPQQQAAGPMAAGPSTREAALAQYDQGVQKDFADRRKSIFDAADAAGPRIGSLQQLGTLLQSHDGGSLSPRGLELAKFANSLGMKVDPMLGNKEAAVALSNQMALDLRNPAGGAGMPGALSDSDRQFLVNMVPGLSTSAQGRSTMIRVATAIEQRKQEVAQFARNYESKYGRLDNGFFDQLAAWSKANPIFEQRQGQ